MGIIKILLVPLAAAFLLLITGRTRILREVLAVGLSGLFLGLSLFLYGHEASFSLKLFSFQLSFSLNPLSWFFLFMVSFFTFLTVIYSARFDYQKNNLSWFHFAFFMKVFSMAAIVLASDLLVFFIFWEIMSLFTYFLMVQKGREKDFSAGAKYLILSLFASVVFLVVLVSLYFKAGSLNYLDVSTYLLRTNLSYAVFVFCGLVLAFLVKSASFPLHYWLPDSYSNAPTTFAAFLSALSSRVGLYGIILLIYILFSGDLSSFRLSHFVNLRYILGIIAAFTMVIPTFTALMQDDAKRLMTWHSIGQGGYMLLGIAVGTPMALAGGLFHIINYASYMLLIFLGIGAVEMRSGTTNLNKLGGLIKKMPVSFLAVLFGIIGLAGIPPMNGFVSKWLLYKSTIAAGFPFLALAAFLGTIGTILSVYKFIHNIFLGQLDGSYQKVKEVPFLMQLPMYVLMVMVWALGIFPSLALEPISRIQMFFGREPLSFSTSGVALSAGHLNMLTINFVMGAMLVLAAAVFLIGHRRIIVSQYNNYAAGHFLDEKTKYNYNYHFYPTLQRFIDSCNKEFINRGVDSIARGARQVSWFLRRIYGGNLNYYAWGITAAFLIIVGSLWFY